MEDMEQQSSHPQARTARVVESLGQRFFVDPITGEILNQPTQHQRHLKRRDLRRFGYVGKDTPWPSLARNAEELLAATEAFDWYADQLTVSSRKILDLLHAGVSENAVRLFDHLARHIAGRNIWFGHIRDVSDSLGMAQRSTERAVQELEQHGLIRRKPQGRFWPTRIDLHPWYAWKGDYMPREAALQQWASKPAKSGGKEALEASEQAA
jgi:DNA-binding transcriptional ArsR family regulator